MKKISIILLTLLVLLTFKTNSFSDGLQSPWENSPKKNDSHSHHFFYYPIKFFKKYISKVDGQRCPMYPCCSSYSIEAIKKHGSWIGFIMTCDRLLHESDEIHLAKRMYFPNRVLFYDPVENNDFWWCDKK